jgi:hypothetical protein
VLVLSTLAAADTGAGGPVAEAGLGLLAYVGDTVILDGSASFDPGGGSLAFSWSQPGGPPVELQRADSDSPRFEVTQSGTLTFELVVTDAAGVASAPDSVSVVVPERTFAEVKEEGCATVPGAGIAACLAALPWLRRRR